MSWIIWLSSLFFVEPYIRFDTDCFGCRRICMKWEKNRVTKMPREAKQNSSEKRSEKKIKLINAKCWTNGQTNQNGIWKICVRHRARARSRSHTHTYALIQTEHTSLLGFYRNTISDVVFIRLIWTYLLLLHSHRRKHRRKLWACVLIADGPGSKINIITCIVCMATWILESVYLSIHRSWYCTSVQFAMYRVRNPSAKFPSAFSKCFGSWFHDVIAWARGCVAFFALCSQTSTACKQFRISHRRNFFGTNSTSINHRRLLACLISNAWHASCVCVCLCERARALRFNGTFFAHTLRAAHHLVFFEWILLFFCLASHSF